VGWDKGGEGGVAAGMGGGGGAARVRMTDGRKVGIDGGDDA